MVAVGWNQRLKGIASGKGRISKPERWIISFDYVLLLVRLVLGERPGKNEQPYSQHLNAHAKFGKPWIRIAHRRYNIIGGFTNDFARL